MEKPDIQLAPPKEDIEVSSLKELSMSLSEKFSETEEEAAKFQQSNVRLKERTKNVLVPDRNEEFEARLKAAKEEERMLNDDIEREKAAIGPLERKIEEGRSRFNSLQTHNVVINEEISRLEKDTSESKSRKKELLQESRNLHQLLNSRYKEKDDLEEKLRKDTEDRSGFHETKEKEGKMEREEISSIEKEQQPKYAQLLRDYQERENEMVQLGNEIENLQQHIKKLEEQSSKVQHKKSEYREKRVKLEQQLEREQQLKEAYGRLEVLRTERKELKNKERDLDKQISEELERSREEESKFKNINKDILGMHDQTSKDTERLSQIDKNISALRLQIERKQNLIPRLSQTLDSLRQGKQKQLELGVKNYKRVIEETMEDILQRKGITGDIERFLGKAERQLEAQLEEDLLLQIWTQQEEQILGSTEEYCRGLEEKLAILVNFRTAQIDQGLLLQSAKEDLEHHEAYLRNQISQERSRINSLRNLRRELALKLRDYGRLPTEELEELNKFHPTQKTTKKKKAKTKEELSLGAKAEKVIVNLWTRFVPWFLSFSPYPLDA